LPVRGKESANLCKGQYFASCATNFTRALPVHLVERMNVYQFGFKGLKT
jgi:hypothetical protein